MRNRNTSQNGYKWSRCMIDKVWEKGHIIVGIDPSEYRKDVCGAIIEYNRYESVNHKYGWEIDHIIPVVEYGTDDLVNLQPLQWKNNMHKANNYPVFDCLIKV